MGRKKEFDEADVLQLAMLQFWQHGYAATTFTQLEQLSGITGRSLINAFGDKDALFDKVLSCYRHMLNEQLALYFSRPGIDAIKEFFTVIATSPVDGPRRFGCLLCNSIFERNDRDYDVEPHISAFRESLMAYFDQSLQADGIASAGSRASFLLNYFWGSVVEIRRQATPMAIAQANGALQGILEAWQAEKSH